MPLEEQAAAYAAEMHSGTVNKSALHNAVTRTWYTKVELQETA